MGSLEEIGALLGVAAFIGFAVLAFLTFQQARHIRRLRDWAGRAPERAAAELDRLETGGAEQTAVLGAGTAPVAAPVPSGPGRLEVWREAFADRWAELDRRSPVNPLVILGGLAAVIAGIAIATGAFGLLGSDSTQSTGSQPPEAAAGTEKQKKLEVAVLNGTAPEGGEGVAGIADKVGKDVKQQGFKLGAVANAGSFPASVVMYKGGNPADAEQVAQAMEPILGPLDVEKLTPEVEAVVEGADLALIVGQDDAGI